MRARNIAIALLASASLAGAALAAPGGNGKGKGGGGSDGGGDDGGDPPAVIVPAIAYFGGGRKTIDLRLANRAGDQACLVLQTPDSGARLRGFAYDAANKRLAYSLDNTGIFITSWGDDPCKVDSRDDIAGEAYRVQSIDHPFVEFMDFSPDGRFLVWGQWDQTTNAPASEIWIYDIIDDGSRKLPLSGFVVGGLNFSPEFDASNELIFGGSRYESGVVEAGNLAPPKLWAYDIGLPTDTVAIPPREIFGALGSGFVSVTHTLGGGEPRVAIDYDGQILQFDLDGTPQEDPFAGAQPVYSCDNSEIIHQYNPRWNKTEIYISSADGSTPTLWSGSDVSWLEWVCP